MSKNTYRANSYTNNIRAALLVLLYVRSYTKSS